MDPGLRRDDGEVREIPPRAGMTLEGSDDGGHGRRAKQNFRPIASSEREMLR